MIGSRGSWPGAGVVEAAVRMVKELPLDRLPVQVSPAGINLCHLHRP